jgi:hypothetical protein
MAKISINYANIVVDIGFFVVCQAGDCDRIRVRNGKVTIRISLAKVIIINRTGRKTVGQAIRGKASFSCPDRFTESDPNFVHVMSAARRRSTIIIADIEGCCTIGDRISIITLVLVDTIYIDTKGKCAACPLSCKGYVIPLIYAEKISA